MMSSNILTKKIIFSQIYNDIKTKIMTLKQILTFTFVLFCFSMMAQTFSPAFGGFSRKKPTFITMKDGTEITVHIKNFKLKKGLVDELKVAPVSGKKKVKINPEDISHMYVPPSALAKIAQTYDAIHDLSKIQDGELNSGHLDEGYLYMESSNVQVKKKKSQYCMLQLMNPSFSKNIKVYNDPYSKESVGVGVGGITVAGGLEKSYYIKKAGEDTARRIKKKEYKQDMDTLFGECPDLITKYGDSPEWSEFEKFIFDYSTMCN